MYWISVVLQIILAAGLINVWIVRNSKSTEYRGSNAQNLKQEFAAYGLPDFVYYLVGFLKLGIALTLIVGLWKPRLNVYALAVLIVLMLGALLMHLKVKDPLKKSIPAFLMLVMSSSLLYFQLSVIT